MANQYKNLTDATLVKTFACPSAASTSASSAGVDLGLGYSGDVECELTVPALSSTIVPNASIVVYVVEASSVSDFSVIDQSYLYESFTASGGTGIAAKTKRCRVPSNGSRYVRGRVQFGAATTTGAAITATFSLKF